MTIIGRCCRGVVFPALCFVSILGAVLAQAAGPWPDLSLPARAVGGGEHDAAVVVGVEGYAFVSPVAGAESNAKLWHQYLTETRGVPAQNAKLLTGVHATRGEILEAVHHAVRRAEKSGTLWFIFIGHGAPSEDGKDVTCALPGSTSASRPEGCGSA